MDKTPEFPFEQAPPQPYERHIVLDSRAVELDCPQRARSAFRPYGRFIQKCDAVAAFDQCLYDADTRNLGCAGEPIE